MTVSRHLTEAQCLDAARGILDPRDKAAFDRHVAVCEACAETVRLWHTVATLALGDERYEPSPAALHLVQSFVAGRQVPRHGTVTRAVERVRELVATLAFDTLQQALPVGVRAGTAHERQLLYDVSPLAVDLRMEAGGRSRRVLLAGQIANALDPSEGGQGARVAVVDEGKEVIAVRANEFGEFECEFDRREDLTLSIELTDGRRFEIPLDRLPVSEDADDNRDK